MILPLLLAATLASPYTPKSWRSSKPILVASRNSSGTYTLPAGNPVVTGTIISSTWANNTFSDVGVELTNSLDRLGRGGMTGALQLANGSVGAPGLTYVSQTTTGLYLAAVSDHRMALAGADAQRWFTTANFLYGPGASTANYTGVASGVGLIALGNGSTSSTALTNTGVAGIGGAGGGTGVFGLGTTGSGFGVYGIGFGGGVGGNFIGGATNAAGVLGTGTAAGQGVSGVGGSTNGIGVTGTGGGTGVGGSFSNGTASTATTPQDAAAYTNGWLNLSAPTAPNSNVAFSNRLTKKNMIKAEGLLTTDGAGNCTVQDGFNITSCTVAVGGVITVNWASSFANTNYAVWGTVSQNGPKMFWINSTPVGLMTFSVCNHASDEPCATPITCNSVVCTISLQAVGSQ